MRTQFFGAMKNMISRGFWATGVILLTLGQGPARAAPAGPPRPGVRTRRPDPARVRLTCQAGAQKYAERALRKTYGRRCPVVMDQYPIIMRALPSNTSVNAAVRAYVFRLIGDAQKQPRAVLMKKEANRNSWRPMGLASVNVIRPSSGGNHTLESRPTSDTQFAIYRFSAKGNMVRSDGLDPVACSVTDESISVAFRAKYPILVDGNARSEVAPGSKNPGQKAYPFIEGTIPRGRSKAAPPTLSAPPPTLSASVETQAQFLFALQRGHWGKRWTTTTTVNTLFHRFGTPGPVQDHE